MFVLSVFLWLDLRLGLCFAKVVGWCCRKPACNSCGQLSYCQFICIIVVILFLILGHWCCIFCLGLSQARLGILMGTGSTLCAVGAHNSIIANQNLMKPLDIMYWLDEY